MSTDQYCSSPPFTHQVNHNKPLIFRKPALRNLLCIGIAIISFTGITQICGLCPDWIAPLIRLLSFIGTLIIIFKAFSIYERRVSQNLHAHVQLKKAEDDLRNDHSNIRKAVLFLLYMDTHLWDKVHTGDTELTDYPYDTPCTKNIGLGLILQRLRELNTFKQIARDELSRAFSLLHEQATFYKLLQKLDHLILQHIPKIIQTVHEKTVFSLRYNLLKFALEASEKDEHFRFEHHETSDYYYTESLSGTSRRKTKYRWEDKPLIDFFIMVLNELYEDDSSYEEQYHEFDIKTFKEYFCAEEATGILMQNELFAEISYYKKAIAELEEEIADLRVHKHDLQIILNAFFAEYNARVGVRYVELDRIKLRIKEYKKRIELAGGKTITDEEADKIEEEIENLFSGARQKVNDLEDETQESTDDYERYIKDEEERELLGQEFLDEIKDLFRRLVRKCHPDMAENEDEKREFHTLFIKIKEAYDNRDIEFLKEFEQRLEIEAEREHETPAEKLERLKSEYERLQIMRKELQAALEAMNNSQLNTLREQVEEERTEGRDLLQCLIDAAEEEIRAKKIELHKLMAEYEQLIAETV